MRFFSFLAVVAALTLSAGAAYFFFGQPKEDPAVVAAYKFQQ
ncbi:MAG: hypothetical protein VW405_05865 [Rhodospirillaceae bacterium]